MLSIDDRLRLTPNDVLNLIERSRPNGLRQLLDVENNLVGCAAGRG